MKKIFTAAALAIATLAPVSAHALADGSKPGYYDMSNITGWQYNTELGVPMWFYLPAAQTGANCNFISELAIGVSNSDLQTSLRAIGPKALQSQLNQLGQEKITKIGPFQKFEVDGIDATRFTSELLVQGQTLSLFQMQFVLKDQVMTVSCGSLPSAFGPVLPELEWFVDKVEFQTNRFVAKIENGPDAEDSTAAITISTGSFSEETATNSLATGMQKVVDFAKEKIAD